MKLNQKFSNLKAEAEISVPYMHTNMTALNISTTQDTAVAAAFTDFKTKYTLYADPATHTTQAVYDMNNSYDNLLHELLGLKKQIKNDKKLTLTGEIITKVNIHVDADKRAHIPAPTDAPLNEVELQKHLVATILTKDPNLPRTTDKGLPPDIKRIGRKLAVVAINAPDPDKSAYHEMDSSGSTTYDLVFNTDQQKSDACLITWYENARGERGPESPMLRFTII